MFCPVCGSWIPPDSRRCWKCGKNLLFEDMDYFLTFVRKLLLHERDEEKKRAQRERISGEVVDVAEEVVTVECKVPMFEEGDVVGYLSSRHEVQPLGVVIAGGRNLMVRLLKPISLREGDSIELCEAEVLVGYDLQLELIERIKEGRLDDLERMAVRVVLGEASFLPPHKITLQDRRDLKDNFFLDSSQTEAVEHILGLKEGEVLLIIGPPGTGKTRVIAKAAYELTEKGNRVLITSHTNRAVDNAIEILPVERALRVGRPERVLRNVRPYLLSFKAKTVLGDRLKELEKRIDHLRKTLRGLYELKNEWYKLGLRGRSLGLKSKSSSLKRELKVLFEERNIMLRNESQRLVRNAQIVGSTLIKSQLPPLADERFDVVLIDECSQASITLALLGMVKAKKWVLIGDHKQLLPIFKTMNLQDRALQEDLSIFCYMMKKYMNRVLWLRRHYRSNSEIIGFSQRYIYGGNITPVDRCKQIKLEVGEKPPNNMEFLDPDKPVVFLGVNGSDAVEHGSRYNWLEVEAVRRIVSNLKKLGVRSVQIGVITPFRSQRRRIKEALRDDGVEVNTVDAFQGREKDVIIFSVTSTSNLSFVEDPNRLNVAFTRARKKLIVLGNPKPIIDHGGLLARFINYVKERKGFYHFDVVNPY